MSSYPHRPELLKRYLELDQGSKVQAECKSPSDIHYLYVQPTYPLSIDVWIDGDGGLRCKTTVSLPALVPLRLITHRVHFGNVG